MSMAFTKKDQKNLNEVHDSVIRIEEHLESVNGNIERHEDDIHGLSDDIKDNRKLVNWNTSKIRVIFGSAAVIAALIPLGVYFL